MIYIDLKAKLLAKGLNPKIALEQLASDLITKSCTVKDPVTGKKFKGDLKKRLDWFFNPLDSQNYWNLTLQPQIAAVLGNSWDMKQLLLAQPELVFELMTTTGVISGGETRITSGEAEKLLLVFNYTSCYDEIQKFLKPLDWSVCPYCNRNFIANFEEDKEGVARTRVSFHMDHFYPKSKFPYLALSVYNLLPSCPTCNVTVKSNLIINTPTPYDPDYQDCQNLQFGVVNDQITLPNQGNYKDFFNVMQTIPLYQNNDDVAIELREKIQEYPEI